MKRFRRRRRHTRTGALLTFEEKFVLAALVTFLLVVCVGLLTWKQTPKEQVVYTQSIFVGGGLAILAVLALFTRSKYLGALVEAENRAAHEAAGLGLILDKHGRILLTQQTSASDAWSGMWLPPGGYHPGEGDTTCGDTATRRAKELVDDRITWTAHGLVGQTDDSPAYHRTVRDAGSSPIHDELYYLKLNGDATCGSPEGLESESARWVGLSTLDDFEVPPHIRALLAYLLKGAPSGLEPPFWTLQEHTIAGLRPLLLEGS